MFILALPGLGTAVACSRIVGIDDVTVRDAGEEIDGSVENHLRAA